ncbi:patatin-like phospholipase family protein [Paracoccus sp. (in: a-proteobacteria)]|uniref:patatin-like phospholipase family protein n=1 Tax=Paracoccus sp. TaxID=267 RepID=UPI0026DF6B0C|nr:patatin-like phospholipase family protein [Paracoccus sp. (in: a-proteobacteria)]MDO5369967.1 patatin-like phospholipase family protein [Paracoccus sp. (in: a-proteobacteria)]
MPKRINLALQGGGAHGAFAWGVLDRLLEGDEIEVAGISGTSAGALNGAAIGAGLASAAGEAGRKAARENLDHVWHEVSRGSDHRLLRWMTCLDHVPSPFQRWAELFSPAAWMENMTRLFSPYDSGPFYSNPLGRIIAGMPHPLGPCADRRPALFVTATNVRDGHVRVFSGDEVTPDAVMASACLPTLFRAVEIEDHKTGRREAYWDGGYSGNPALFPLFAPELPRDIVIVTINPMRREAIPQSPVEIQDRINEVSFNSSLLRELRAIQFVKRLTAEGRLTGRDMKEPLIHLLSDEELMNSLGARTKLLPGAGLVARMKEAGRLATEKFLVGDARNIGARDSVDLPRLYG